MSDGLPSDLVFCLQLMDENPNYSFVCPIGNGMWAGVCQFAFTGAILTGRIGEYNFYEDRWCFSDVKKARSSLEEWISERRCEGEPQGWHRHPATGRRRPDGDESKEYINF